MANLRIPSYVPDAVKKLARVTLANEIEKFPEQKREEAWAVTRRLLHDKRMKWVWRELTRHVRQKYEKTEELVHKPAEIPPLIIIDENGQEHEVSTGLDEALSTLFHRAVILAVDPISTITHDEAMELYAEVSELEKRLIEDAKRLRTLNRNPQIQGFFVMLLQENPNFPKGKFELGRLYDWTNLNDFAEVFEQLAVFFRRVGASPDFKPYGSHPLVKRRTADERTRGYVLELAKVFKDVFKSPKFYGTIATISAVALKKKVSAPYVRKVVQQSSL